MAQLAGDLLAMQNGVELPGDSYMHLMSCSLCDLCTVDCPEGLSCATLVRAGRALLMQEYEGLQEHYRPYRVDLPSNHFSDLRRARGIVYEEGLHEVGAPGNTGAKGRLFMPGCALSCSGEAITKAVFDRLKAHDLVDAMTLHCCGNPLNSAGYGEQFTQYTAWLTSMLASNGVREIITACPNCYRSLRETFEQQARAIEVVPLPRALLAAGMRYDPGAQPGGGHQSVSIHDSCPDRHDPVFAASLRELFSGCELREMAHHGRHTICCGSGGLAALNSPGTALERCERRYREFLDTGAGCLVTYCAACSNSFSQLQQAKPVRHYLELLFDQRFEL
jgi:Fe-S oxidoreductase